MANSLVDIQAAKKKDMIFIVNNFFIFWDTNFISNYSKKEALNFLVDALIRRFCETHRVEDCYENVSLFLIVRRKMAYLGVPKKKYVILDGYNFLNICGR